MASITGKPSVSLAVPSPIGLPSSHIVNCLPAPRVWDMESTHRAEEHPFNVHVLHLYLIYIKYVSLIFGKTKCLHLVHVGYLNLVHRGHLYLIPLYHLYI